MPNVIRIGDPTSHDGKVVESGAPQFLVDGRPVALVGDRCICPVQGHQVCIIVSGNARHIVNGKPVAYEGDKTSCGAQLLSTVKNFVAS